MTGLNGALEACITSERSRSPDPRSPNTLWDATDLDVTQDPEEWLISKPQNLNEDVLEVNSSGFGRVCPFGMR